MTGGVMREVNDAYCDPLDAIWLAIARELGLEVVRSDEVYAAVADGVLTLGAPHTLDADDAVCQMVLHELCHALVQGPANQSAPDWGLDNTSSRDVLAERACLRLQAWLTDRWGLRWVLAPTTEFRRYYDMLPKDPLSGDAPETAVAVAAKERLADHPIGRALERGLAATATVVAAAAPFCAEGSLLAQFDG